MGKNRQLTAALPIFVRRRAQECGILLDTYDPDALVSIVQEYLKEHDAALTSSGVRRFRR